MLRGRVSSYPEDAATIRELVDQAGLTVDLQQQTAATLRAGHHPGRTDAPSSTLGRYPVTGHLGAGGMGEVLQVRDEDVGREMAAKVILGEAGQETLAKFVREGQITGQLEHPNIVPLYELGMTPDKRIYFTMKRVEGDDLAALLEAERAGEGALLAKGSGPRPSSRRLAVDLDGMRRTSLMKYLNIFLKVCDAISFAHSRGVIHRDLNQPTSWSVASAKYRSWTGAWPRLWIKRIQLLTAAPWIWVAGRSRSWPKAR